jgi:NADH:ubiquinone oxidoreductase subunit H
MLDPFFSCCFLVVVFLLLMIFVTVDVAFLTWLERKVLGYIHIRKRPNKVEFVGIFQPFRDAIMSFFREQYFPPTPTLSPSFLLAQAIFEPNLFPYEYPNISPT